MAAVTTAVILAAGRGTRLGEFAADLPKGLLRLNGATLVERSCRRLVKAGITRILIGTGYREDAYRAFTSSFDAAEIECVYNPDFTTSGNTYTLSTMRDRLDEPFLLLESDLLYEARALEVLQAAEPDTLMLASGPTSAGDEVYMEVDDSGNLFNLSKQPGDLGSVYGELVGINKLSTEVFHLACEVMAERMDSDPFLDYERALVGVSRTRVGVPVLRIDDLVWCEVDDPSHVRRAVDVVLPRLEGDEGG